MQIAYPELYVTMGLARGKILESPDRAPVMIPAIEITNRSASAAVGGNR